VTGRATARSFARKFVFTESWMTITRRHTDSRLARVVTHNGVAYLSGTTADDRSASMKAQTEQVLRKIDALLTQAGTDKSRLLSATIWISDMQRKAEMDEAWIAWIDPQNPPARATVRADLGTRDTLVEVMVTAALA
jgi:enamine deaminase RidA (YjgF/YER057c/UK114 family)